jgi:protocatechuate 3,4-dioxygenase, alpha subunit
MKDEEPLVATPSQTVGPFFHFGMTVAIGNAGDASANAEQIRVTVRVLDGDGVGLDDALVEFWHGGAGGLATACGRAATQADGSCEIATARPRSHLNLCIFARGLLRQIYTRIYFDGDPALPADRVLALVPEDRRQTLVARADPHIPGRWRFDVHLQGPQETVFFDR